MKIEHVALQVDDPVSVAKWWTAHLGMTVKRSEEVSPFGHFLADDGDAVMIEIYHNPVVPVPDYSAVDPALMHIAFASDDVEADRDRLVAAGATQVGELMHTEELDTVVILRDPWGIPIQLAKRSARMISR